jgi:hypothetical protein
MKNRRREPVMNIIKSVTLVARTPGNVSHSDRGGFMSTKRFATCAAALVLLSGLVSAQQTVTQPGREMTVSGTIQEIDYTTRLVTLRRADGTDEIVYAPTSITRLNELKVGDRINTKYYESTILQLRKPGEPSSAPSGSAVTPTTGALPGATVARQASMTVTVKAVDPAIPSITVTTPGGRTIAKKVQQASNLANVKVGDRIDITYTEAALISVERAQ